MYVESGYNLEGIFFFRRNLIIIFNFLIVDMCVECDFYVWCINGKCFCRRGYFGDGFLCKRGRFVFFNENEKFFIINR